jgi:WD40 repeat protein/energy-coupling factor transporter ATP-binding protein EcfA2
MRIMDTRDQRRAAQLAELKSRMRTSLAVSDTLAENPTDSSVVNYELSVSSYLNSDSSWMTYIQNWERYMRQKLQQSLEDVFEMRNSWMRDGCGAGIAGSLLSELLHHSKWAAEKCRQFSGREELLQEMMRLIHLPNRERSSANAPMSARRQYAGTGPGRGPGGRTLLRSSSSRSSERSDDGDAQPDSIGHFDGISLAVIGNSGSGKTSLMAMLAVKIFEEEQHAHAADASTSSPRPVIIRFCGSSAGSTSGWTLVCGIIAQIRHVLGIAATRSPRGNQKRFFCQSETQSMDAFLHLDYDSAVSQLHLLLRENPVVLLIDSVDQLSDDFLARSRLSFLDGVQPHPRTRIIISGLPDEKDPVSGTWTYCYQCHTRCKESNVPMIYVSSFSKGFEFQTVVSTMLQAKGRRLTEQQWAIVLEAAKPEPTALYGALVARIVELWTSFDTNLELKPTVKGLLHQTFDSLERQFGTILTRAALGLITFSVSGLTDNEIEDLLSMDDDVLNSVFQYAKSSVRRLPSHVWLRLRGAMAGLLVERTGGCLGWYHRQLWETAVQRYSGKEKEHFHILMGMYFSNTVANDIKVSRRIASQPLTFTSTNVFFVCTDNSSEVQINMRRVIESLHHLVCGKLYEEFVAQIRDVAVVFATVAWGNPFQFISQLSIVKAELKSGATSPTKLKPTELLHYVDDYLRWLRMDITAIIAAPERALFTTATGWCSVARTQLFIEVFCYVGNQPVTSLARQDMLRYFTKINGYRKQGSDVQFSASSWIRCRVLSDRITNSFGRLRYGALTSSLRGHNNSVYSMSWSRRRNVIVSGSSDKMILLWDVDTGNVNGRIEGHTDVVRAVAFCPDDLRIASASKDNTVRVWDSVTGSQVLLLTGHTKNVWAVSWSPNGNYLVTCASDSTVRIWNCKTTQDSIERDSSERCVCVLTNHTKGVMSTRWRPQGDYIASVAADSTVKFWKVDGFAATNHTASVDDIVVSHYASFPSMMGSGLVCEWSTYSGVLAAGGVEGKIHFYRLEPDGTWNEYLSLGSENASHLRALAFAKQDALILSGNFSGNVFIWDLVRESLVYYARVFGIIYEVAFSPHDEHAFAVCSQAGTIDLFRVDDINNPDVTKPIIHLPGKGKELHGSALSEAELIKYLPNADDSSAISTAETEISHQIKNVRSSIIWLTYSNAGDLLASAAGGGEIFVWEMATGRKKIEFNIGANNGRLSWSSSGELLACCADLKTALVVNVHTGVRIVELVGHSDYVYACLWCFDDKYLVTSSMDGSLRLWDAQTGATIGVETIGGRLRSMSHHSHVDGSLSIAFSNDMASGHINVVNIQLLVDEPSSARTAQWHHLESLEGPPTHSVRALFDHKGKSVAATCINEKIYVWDVGNSTPRFILSGHGHVIWAICWSTDDSKIYSGDWLGLMFCWDAYTGRMLHKYEYTGKSVCTCDISPVDNVMAVGLSDGTVSLMNPTAFIPVSSFYVGKVIVHTVDISPCGQWIVAGYHDGIIRVFHVPTMDAYCELKAHLLEVNALLFSHNGDLVISSSGDGAICVWTVENKLISNDIGNGRISDLQIMLRSKACHTNSVKALCLSPCERFVAIAGQTTSVEVLDVATLSRVGLISNGQSVDSIGWSRCGRQIATASIANTISVFEVGSAEEFLFSMGSGDALSIKHLVGHTGGVLDLDWNAGRKNLLLSCSLDRTIRIWDTSTLNSIMTIQCTASCAQLAKWSRDGSDRIVSAGADHCIRVWDSEKGVSLAELFDHTDSVLMVKFWSARSRLVGSVESIGAVDSGELQDRNDGTTMIVSCSADGSIRIWDSVEL